MVVCTSVAAVSTSLLRRRRVGDALGAAALLHVDPRRAAQLHIDRERRRVITINSITTIITNSITTTPWPAHPRLASTSGPACRDGRRAVAAPVNAIAHRIAALRPPSRHAAPRPARALPVAAAMRHIDLRAPSKLQHSNLAQTAKNEGTDR
eukprot:2888837-Pleurochrysis_carterae.AAC.2